MKVSYTTTRGDIYRRVFSSKYAAYTWLYGKLAPCYIADGEEISRESIMAYLDEYKRLNKR